MEMINKIPAFFTREFKHWKKVELFRKVLYWFLLLNTLSLLPAAEEIWSYNGIVGGRGWYTDIPWYKQGSYGLLNILSHPANSYMTWVYKGFVFGQLFFLVLGLLRILPVISSVMIYFFTVNLFHKGFLMFTGGEVLIGILLFYLMFIQCSYKSRGGVRGLFERRKAEEPEFSSLQNVLNNTFYLLMLLQVCILYFFSTLYKIYDDHWASGHAIMYISRIETFSSGMMKYLFSDNVLLSQIATYTALVYQGLFPFVVWIRKIKVPFLLFGVLFHLGIAFGMGIFTFGIIMILVYLLFLDEDQILWIKRRFSFKRAPDSA